MNMDIEAAIENVDHKKWINRWEQGWRVVDPSAQQGYLQRLFGLVEGTAFSEPVKEFLFYPQEATAKNSIGYNFVPVKDLQPEFAYQLGAAYYGILNQKVDMLSQDEEIVMSRYLGSMRYSDELKEKTQTQSNVISALANVMPIADGVYAEDWNEMDGMIKGEYLVRLSDAADYAMQRMGVVDQQENAVEAHESKLLRLIEATENLSHAQSVIFLQHDKTLSLVDSEVALKSSENSDDADGKLSALQQDVRTLFSENAERGAFIVALAGPKERLARSAERFRSADKMTPEKREGQLKQIAAVMCDAPAEFGNMSAAIDRANEKTAEYKSTYQPKPYWN